MKKTNAIISLVASLFVSASAIAAVPTMELVKAEPVQSTNLSLVQATLVNSMSELKVNPDYNESLKTHPITLMKKKANQRVIVNVASNEVIAD
jgi:hypothetical protein